MRAQACNCGCNTKRHENNELCLSRPPEAALPLRMATQVSTATLATTAGRRGTQRAVFKAQVHSGAAVTTAHPTAKHGPARRAESGPLGSNPTGSHDTNVAAAAIVSPHLTHDAHLASAVLKTRSAPSREARRLIPEAGLQKSPCTCVNKYKLPTDHTQKSHTPATESERRGRPNPEAGPYISLYMSTHASVVYTSSYSNSL